MWATGGKRNENFMHDNFVEDGRVFPRDFAHFQNRWIKRLFPVAFSQPTRRTTVSELSAEDGTNVAFQELPKKVGRALDSLFSNPDAERLFNKPQIIAIVQRTRKTTLDAKAAGKEEQKTDDKKAKEPKK